MMVLVNSSAFLLMAKHYQSSRRYVTPKDWTMIPTTKKTIHVNGLLVE